MEMTEPPVTNFHFYNFSLLRNEESSDSVGLRMVKMAHYKTLFLSVFLHLILMYFIGYSLIYVTDDFFLNINRFYMAGMMVSSMLVVMVIAMKGMLPKKILNAAIVFSGIGLFVLFFSLGRSQAFVGDMQFLRSMIPHHSSAILMCERAHLDDGELRELCKRIEAPVLS